MRYRPSLLCRQFETNEGTPVFTDGKTKNSRRGIELSAATVQVLQAQKLTLDAMAIVRDGWENNDLVFPIVGRNSTRHKEPSKDMEQVLEGHVYRGQCDISYMPPHPREYESDEG